MVVDSLNGEDLDRACDNLNRLIHELTRVGENDGLPRSVGLGVCELDDYTLEIL